MIDALFFDVDGVLIDSVGVKGDAFVDAFAGYPERRNAIIAVHQANGGLPRGSKIRRIIEEVFDRDATTAEVERITALFAASVLDRVLGAPEIDGASAALTALGRDIPLHAVSATPEAELIHILAQRNWTRHFTSIHGVPPEKTETVRILIHRHGYKPVRCFLIGDSSHDHVAAVANGVPFIHVSTNEGDRIPDAVTMIPDLVSLPHLLLGAPKMDT
jgi:phosphoglycolate phosphatase-like HAD superfamily hydrolase